MSNRSCWLASIIDRCIMHDEGKTQIDITVQITGMAVALRVFSLEEEDNVQGGRTAIKLDSTKYSGFCLC